MAKWINLPSNSWFHTEFVQNPLLSMHHVVDHIFVDRTSFIMHRPASIENFKLTIADQVFNVLLCFIILLIVPSFEKGHFNFRKLSLWIGNKRFNHCCKLNLHISILCVLISSIKVFIKSLNPPNVIMRVRSDMNCPWIRLIRMITDAFKNLSG